MTDKEKIRAEIEKKIKVLSPFTHQGSDTCGKIIRQLESLVSFIDSLPEEFVNENRREAILKKAHELAKKAELIKGDLPKSTIVALAVDMAEWCDSHPIKEPVSEDLEEAAINYAATGEFLDNGKEMIDFQKEKSFKAGAEWQFEHQWISVKDRLPTEEFDDGYTFVFVKVDVDEDTYRLETDYIRNGKWELHPNENITHWMPIPPIPNKED